MKKRFFITWVTHNSRYSEKMWLLKLKKKEGYFLNFENRVFLYKLIIEHLDKYDVKYFALNILSDHVHLIIEYWEKQLPELIRKIKWGVSFNYCRKNNISQSWDGKINKLWARWYSTTFINTEEQFYKAIEYTKNNHIKHDIENIYPEINRGL